MKKPVKIAAITVSTAAIICGGGFLAWNIIDNQPFRLDNEYYAASESVDLNKDDYEKLIADKKSFVVMIDKPGCFTTEKMRNNMADFPEDTHFKYYRMMWDDVKESSLHEYVKFTPSVAIIRSGRVKAWLQADRDEDSIYFESGSALKDWIRKYIIF